MSRKKILSEAENKIVAKLNPRRNGPYLITNTMLDNHASIQKLREPNKGEEHLVSIQLLMWVIDAAKPNPRREIFKKMQKKMEGVGNEIMRGIAEFV